MTELRAVHPDSLPRTFVCRWIAGLFLVPPDASALGAYQGPEGLALLASLAREPALAPAARDLAALTAPGADLTLAAGRVAAAHSAAFLVGGRRTAPPYASVWVDDRGLLYQEPARRMARLLEAAGLVLPPEVREPPDHIGFQLNLLAELVDRARAGQSVPLAPADFVRDELMPWLPRFADACAQTRSSLLYAALARATLDYLSEKQW